MHVNVSRRQEQDAVPFVSWSHTHVPCHVSQGKFDACGDVSASYPHDGPYKWRVSCLHENAKMTFRDLSWLAMYGDMERYTMSYKAQRIRVSVSDDDPMGRIVTRNITGVRVVEDGLGIEHEKGQAFATIDGKPYVLLVSRPLRLKDVNGIAWRARYVARSYSENAGDTEEQRQASIQAAAYMRDRLGADGI